MEARILERREEGLWANFIKSHPYATIHQSPVWGHFQKSIRGQRGKYWIVVLEEQEGRKRKIIGGTILIRHKLPKNYCWFYAARGPLLDYTETEKQKQMNKMLEVIKPLAKKEKAIFMRIDPAIVSEVSDGTNTREFPKFQGFYMVKAGFQPQHTLIKDLSLSEEELLHEMKPKGRYNIKLAAKKGVKIKNYTSRNKAKLPKYVNKFYNILMETTERDGFTPHNRAFYQKMLKSLPQNTVLYIAEYKNHAIAGLIITYFGDTATYYYGASGNEYRNLMAPYLLQWQAMLDAKKDGYTYYDFMGIAPQNAKNHPWKGVTEFKLKFGGEEISYFQPQEYPFKHFLHFLYHLYKRIR